MQDKTSLSGTAILPTNPRLDGVVVPRVPKPIRRRSERPPRETPEIGKDLQRFMRRFGDRVAQGDPSDLNLLLELERVVKRAQRTAVDGLRSQGYSDDTIGKAVGKYRQWVEFHWPRPRPWERS